MACAIPNRTKVIYTIAAWAIGLAIFFPIQWTTESYNEMLDRSPYFRHFMNSVVVSLGSTLIGLLIAVPAAWSMAFNPTKTSRTC
ncbi:MAG: sorbitol/mannitol transport system permease protein [Paracoccaceae bacterium]|jgi:sorbitol/mannitol transport system permease protein